MRGLINSRVKDPEIHVRQHKRPQFHITLRRPTVSQHTEKAESLKTGRNCCMTYSLTLSFTDVVSNPYVGFRHRKRKSVIDSRGSAY